jgi:hypothetical protein
VRGGALAGVEHSAESIFIIEYLCKYEFIFETAVAHEVVGPGVLIDEKTEGRKSRASVPLTKFVKTKSSLKVWW